jgi:hypothetical protein
MKAQKEEEENSLRFAEEAARCSPQYAVRRATVNGLRKPVVEV